MFAHENSDVMISYSSPTGEKVAFDLENRLDQKMHTVWIEENTILRDLTESVANAIKNSKLVLILISKEYEESYSCQLEYMFAKRCNKNIIPIKVQDYSPPPDSKLALCIAGLKYHSLYNQETYGKDLNKLIAEIEKELRNTQRIIVPQNVFSVESEIDVNIEFTNRADCHVIIHWIDYDGQGRVVKKLRNGRSHKEATFETHPWMASTLDDDGNHIMLNINDELVYLPQCNGRNKVEVIITKGAVIYRP